MTRTAFRAASIDASTVRSALGRIGQVLEPHEAEEPILAASVRLSVFGWLTEINARDELSAVGLKPRSTALLFGPPGCGKTTLAHHLAARLGVPMVNVGADHLISSLFGESEKAVAQLFDALDEVRGKCLLFLDEIDAFGGKRTDTSQDRGGAPSARNSMLTVLLRRIEDFGGVMIAATNRPDSLDPALWRRFGMQIDVALPDDDARWAIIKRYAAPFDLTDEAVDLLTSLTTGAAPSLLRQLMEGMKRTLVLGRRLRLPNETALDVFAPLVAQTKPHPDYTPPPLWTSPSCLAELGAVPWPPSRQG